MSASAEQPVVVSAEVFHQYHVVIDGILSLSTCPLCALAVRKPLPATSSARQSA